MPRLADGRVDVHAAARRLIAAIADEPWGHLSASVYETARLVTLAPWLTGHVSRIAFLLDGQRPDGSWDGPDGYRLVPTLSAAEALLTTLHRSENGQTDAAQRFPRGQLLDSANRALYASVGCLHASTEAALPDTPAVEIIVPALVADVNRHLDRLSGSPLPGLDTPAGNRLALPSTLDGEIVAAIRARVRAGTPVPAKLLHSLEVADGHARKASGVRPVPPGTVGASPAATAAWLGSHDPPSQSDPAVRYLRAVVARHAGPVPSVVPVTVFERAWVLNSLAIAQLHPSVPPGVPASILASLGESGTPGGAGLPADADTTGAALLALARLGRPRALDCLWTFETSSHFVTWHGERTASPTTNAHVLDAIAYRSRNAAGAAPRVLAAGRKVSRWLCDQQRADGSWHDKWHASAYYATACCALALHNFGGTDAAPAVRRATGWVLGSQRTDGGWGRWRGTVEETAYALQLLLLTMPPGRQRNRAAAHGYTYLRGRADDADRPPLWHDKDLYVPYAVVESALIAALHLAQRDPAVMALVAGR